MRVPFVKMHGLGNDFVVLDGRAVDLPAVDNRLAAALADRHTGIGCDQLIVLSPSSVADLRMRIFNADGGEVEACGNATRAVAVLHGGAARIETLGGILATSSGTGGVAVEMGVPRFAWEDIPLAYALDTVSLPLAWETLANPVAVNVGNPHVVFFVEDCDAVDLARLGPEIEHDALFPQRVNVNVASVTGRDVIRLRVWERGAGLTRACGTGACATAVAAMRRGLVDRRVAVTLPGGTLTIEWRPDGQVVMTGPAVEAYRGSFEEQRLWSRSVSVEVVTLGCRLNIAESDAIAAMLSDADDTVVINSCAVTTEAARHTRQAIRRARRRRPEARLIVTGCAVGIEGAQLADMPEIDAVVANADKFEAAAYRDEREGQPFDQLGASGVSNGNDYSARAELVEAPPLGQHTRAFVPIQTGCDHACTFCAIPQGRGPSRSRAVTEVVAEVARQVAGGAREAVLTGVDVTAWGLDLPGGQRLGNLVAAILAGCPTLARLRLSSLDGVEIDATLFELLAREARVMPHLHLSLQSGDDLTLKRMKRRHSRGDAVRLVERLRARRPDIAIGADLIAGFPTETEAMHRNNLSIVHELGIVHGHVFPYSPRPGTPAARMPQVAPALIRERAAELRQAAASERRRWLEGLVGQPLRVLAERDGTGHAENFAPVRLPAGSAAGTIIEPTPTTIEQGMLA